jgi:nucleotide-binding universal stress UspA family protein
MDAKKILFPTDFSTASDAGLPLATTLAKEMGATLVVLHVEEPPIAYGGGELYYGLPEPDHPALVKMLHNVKPSDTKVRCEHRMLVGDPATEIVKAADDENVAMIVLGTHGRTGLNRFLMGSVAEQVVRKAKCPVVTLKQPHLQSAENKPLFAATD